MDENQAIQQRSVNQLEDSAREQTYLTLLSTDKPIYRPGETVYIRGVILHSLKLKSVDSLTPEAHLKVFAPNGDNIFSARANFEDSVVSAFYKIPDDRAGGDYKLQITYPYDSGFTGSEREFNIRAFRAPRLKTQLKFLQKAYGPGDKAVASLEVLRAEGGVPQNASITAIATIDNTEVYRGAVSLDSAGTALITFDLPTLITTGDGTLVCKIQDGGVTESATKTIPILLQTMEIYIYPEGGDLISDVENTFYVESFTKTKDPGDITAEVRNKKTKEVVAMVTTEHEGRGKSKFVPKEGEEYVLHVIRPSGILNEIEFPKSKKQGGMLKSNEDAFTKDHVTVTLNSNVTSKYTVILSKKLWKLSSGEYELQNGVEKTVELNTKGAHGVLTVTVISNGTPVAERLVFVRSQKSIQVEIQPEKASYTPGSKVKLLIKTKTEDGTPISSNVGLQVTDDAVLELVEKRKQSPRLPAMALLEPEVNELYDSDVLLSNDRYIDLLLGTQGWRKFVSETELLEKGIKGERVLGIHHPKPRAAPPRVRMAMNMFRKPMAAERVLAAAPHRAERKKEAEPALELAMAAPRRREAKIAPAMERAMAPSPALAQPPIQQAQAQKQDVPIPGPALGKAMPALGKAMPARGMAAPIFPELVHPIQENIEQQQVVRVYAHVRGPRQFNERTDFTETVYWAANVKTDAKGEATVEFELSDSITTFKAFADCFADARLGTASARVESKNPFYMEPKLPLEVTYGDSISAPIALVNETGETLQGTIKTEILGTGVTAGEVNLDFNLKAQERQRKIVPLQVGNVAEQAQLKISALTDSVTRPIRIVPKGFPFQFAAGGLLEQNSTRSHKFTIPSTLVPNSFETAVKVFSTPASTLTESLKGFIREPCGCFEQTSMTSYPLVMVLRYFKTHMGVDPTLIESATEMLTKGYKRLTSYECKQGGYEWFGKDPAHEALTAYGVLQFTEMSKVYPVDMAMLQRTTNWLLSRRDGKGGFLRSPQALDQFGGAPHDTTNAYIVWALTEAGIDVKPEVDAVITSVKENGFKDSYLLALITATLYKLKRNDEARFHADHLVKLLDSRDGSVKDAAATITMSRGDSRTIETTSLAIISWLHDSKYYDAIELAMKYLQSVCKNGCFGSTQSTVLALRAIVNYDECRSSPPSEGSVVVKLNGKEVTSLGFGKTTTGTLEAPSFAEALSSGDHEIEIEMVEGGRMPYTISINYFALSGATSSECAVDLKTRLGAAQISEGEVCRMNVVVENKTKEVLPMTIAIIGVPGGLEVRHDQLKELVKKEEVAFYETRGRDIVFYWRYFKESEKKELNVDLLAAVPGKYTAAASSAYLYYTNEHKVWQEGLSVEVLYK